MADRHHTLRTRRTHQGEDTGGLPCQRQRRLGQLRQTLSRLRKTTPRHRCQQGGDGRLQAAVECRHRTGPEGIRRRQRQRSRRPPGGHQRRQGRHGRRQCHHRPGGCRCHGLGGGTRQIPLGKPHRQRAHRHHQPTLCPRSHHGLRANGLLRRDGSRGERAGLLLEPVSRAHHQRPPHHTLPHQQRAHLLVGRPPAGHLLLHARLRRHQGTAGGLW